VAIVAGAVVGVAVLGGATALAVANSTAGTTVTVDRTAEPSTTPVVDMNTPEWRYIGRLCKSGDLLVSLAEANSRLRRRRDRQPGVRPGLTRVGSTHPGLGGWSTS
jgi:hypothetical protein